MDARVIPPVLIVLFLFSQAASCQANEVGVSVSRDLPDEFDAGTELHVVLSVDVDESSKPNGLVVTECLPWGWGVDSADPAYMKYDSTLNEYSWLFYGNDVRDRDLTYVIQVPDPTGEILALFQGMVETSMGSASIGGDESTWMRGMNPDSMTIMLPDDYPEEDVTSTTLEDLLESTTTSLAETMGESTTTSITGSTITITSTAESTSTTTPVTSTTTSTYMTTSTTLLDQQSSDQGIPGIYLLAALAMLVILLVLAILMVLILLKIIKKIL